MRIQVLVASMFQNDYSLVDKMNIQTDAIIGNQCDRNEIEEYKKNGCNIKFLSFNERGVGLNRNNALMRADADICLFADDDMRFVDDYESIVKKAFEENTKADVIVFNLKENQVKRYINKKNHRIGKLNYLRYGAARIAVRLAPIKSHNIYFNQCFGGGTEHCSGEDNIFLADCLSKGLKVYASPYYIAELLDDRRSSWFRGFDDKYFRDKGALFRTIYPKMWKVLCLQDAIRHANIYEMNFVKSYKRMVNEK